MALWSGRFSGGQKNELIEFTESVSFDKRLYSHDIDGSKAHVDMLASCRIIPAKTAKSIKRELEKIRKRIDEGRFKFTSRLEDIHMHIESEIIKALGDEGARLHTARSRNDQVNLDTRLYLRDESVKIVLGIRNLQRALVSQAENNSNAIMPGYTHLQHAQPVLFAHHMLAYVEMFSRDSSRLLDCLGRLNILTLGSGAIAGTTLPINRKKVAKDLSFPEISANSMDAVADRDFECEFLACLAIFAMHVSRLSEDIVLWSSREFSFVELADEFCTGSSLMPQKKNPDVAELARGKTGRIYGNLVALLTICKGLPMSYNRDLQEDKEPLFDSIDTVIKILSVLPPMLATMHVRKEKMLAAANNPELMATDLAEELVKLGVPFRKAHERTGALVKWCSSNKVPLNKVSFNEMKKHIPEANKALLKIFDPARSVSKREVDGGTGPCEVRSRIDYWRKKLQK
ncbi:MAG TPA: argininosuccinate lyase [Lentisphaeria bacterium]|nr:MAG: argininosuccinate lyase [Lentisphaerae bacterium GWF2_49_21]HBC85480.1 argininosuccinate lyase [Lentisphaeria bacterium]